MKTISVSALALITALAASTALAADKPANTTTAPATTTPATTSAKAGVPHHGKMGEHMFKEVDTDNDGTISKDEWTAKGDKMFADIDANHDGKLTPDEMKAHHEAMRAKFGHKGGEHGGKVDAPKADSVTPAESKK